MPRVKLKKNRDKSVLRKHPWIFSGAIDSIENVNKNGETVEIISGDGKFLGFGSYSIHSQIAVRVLSFNREDIITKNFFEQRIIDAIHLRDLIINKASTNAYRLINAESDGLPGVIIDVYDKHVVCQFLSAGSEYWKNDIVEILIKTLKPLSIYERSDSDIREKEGLEPKSGVIYGQITNDLIEIKENDLRFFIDILNGHKTGFYLDQRDNRNLVRQFAEGKSVLNCFSYTGGFSIYALKGFARNVINVDSSSDALMLSEKNMSANGFSSDSYENINDDVFKYLRKLRDKNAQFDLIILDPPKFAESISQVEKAGKGYKDINLLAIKLLKKYGLLFTFSCSGHITADLFSKIVSDAAIDSSRDLRVIKHLTQSSDHSISTNFPESLYLKGLVCQVI